MPVSSATQAVGAGIATANVVTALAASYQITISPSWVTTWDVVAKTAAGFTVNFSNPAPPGGGTFDWIADVSGAVIAVGGTLSVGATQAITAAAAVATVPVSFGGSLAFQVGITPSWVTAWDILKSTNGFTIVFAVPAPAGGGTFDWIAVSTTAATLGPAASPLASATQALLVGVASVAIVTAAGVNYEVMLAPSWVTAYRVTGKTAAGFTVDFSVPAPPGGGTFDWVVWSGGVGLVALSDYLSDLRTLLRDPNDDIWSQTIKTQLINKALHRRDLDTEANRTLISLVLTAGTDTYSFASLGNTRVFDVIGINLIFVAQRIVLGHLSFTELNQMYRPWVPWTDIPRAFARYGPSTVIFGPTPGFAYTSEWDCAVYSNPLVNLTDTDVLPLPYTTPVPFYAAHLAKLNERQWDEADDFMAQYREQVNTAINARVGMDPQVARI